MLRQGLFGAPLLAGALCCAPALAQNPPDDPHFYAGASLGRSSIENDRTLQRERFQSSDFGWKLFGGYQVADWLGAELGYVSFGGASDTVGMERYDARVRGLTAMGVASVAVQDFDVFAKAGVARLDNRLTSATVRVDRTDMRLAWGLGTRWSSGNLGVRAEYERFRMPGGNPDMLSVGVSFAFR